MYYEKTPRVVIIITIIINKMVTECGLIAHTSTYGQSMVSLVYSIKIKFSLEFTSTLPLCVYGYLVTTVPTGVRCPVIKFTVGYRFVGQTVPE